MIPTPHGPRFAYFGCVSCWFVLGPGHQNRLRAIINSWPMTRSATSRHILIAPLICIWTAFVFGTKRTSSAVMGSPPQGYHTCKCAPPPPPPPPVAAPSLARAPAPQALVLAPALTPALVLAPALHVAAHPAPGLGAPLGFQDAAIHPAHGLGAPLGLQDAINMYQFILRTLGPEAAQHLHASANAMLSARHLHASTNAMLSAMSRLQ